MAQTHAQRRLLSATRLGILLLGLAAAIGLAIAAVSMGPSWSPPFRAPLPDPPSASVGERIVAREPAAPVQRPSEPDRDRRVATTAPADDVPAPVADAGRPPPAASVKPDLVVSTPRPPRREPPPPVRDRPAPERVTPAAPEPAAAPVSPAPPAEAAPPPEAPQPVAEALVSTHPGQGNAYGKDNGNGPPGGVPPGQVGR